MKNVTSGPKLGHEEEAYASYSDDENRRFGTRSSFSAACERMI